MCLRAALATRSGALLPGKRSGKKRVGLSLHVGRLNSGIELEGLTAGLALAACVSSVEDHGFLLSLGIKARALLPLTRPWRLPCGRLLGACSVVRWGRAPACVPALALGFSGGAA